MEAYHATRLLVRELSLSSAMTALARAAVAVERLQIRLCHEARPATAQMAVVDQAICWSIALYLELRRLRGQPRALEVMRQLVVASGQRLVANAFPPLRAEHPLDDLQQFVIPALRHAEVHGLYQLANVERGGPPGDALSFEITYCRYAEMSRLAGAEPLAECFCAVDGPFFAELCPGLEFSCQQRIASGHRACTFRFATKTKD